MPAATWWQEDFCSTKETHSGTEKFRPLRRKRWDWYHQKRQEQIAVSQATEVLRQMSLDSCVAGEQAEVVTKESVKEKFFRLADEWSEAVRNVSSLTAMAAHSKYREIISLGWEAVPFLLADLRDNNRFWFPALAEITKIRPYDPRDVGNSKKMIDAWIRWGKKKNLI